MKHLYHNDFDTAILLQDLFDDAYDLIQFVQLDGTLLLVNKAWSTLLGYKSEEIVGKSIYSFISQKDRAHYENYRNKIIKGEAADKSIIFTLQNAAGEVIPVEGALSVKRVDGKPLYTRGIFRDISVRLHNEMQLQRLNAELNEREQNLRSLLVYAPDAVIVIDDESHITFWNPKAEALFGWHREEVLNKNLSEFIIPAPYRDAHHKGMQRFLKSGEARVLNKTIEITALKKSGEEFYVALTISETQQNGRSAFIAFLRDISAQKHNQIELEKKTQQLERSNSYLEDFAHVASHDLKEPLRKIMIFAGWLKESLKKHLTEKDKMHFERLDTSAKRMQLLVDDLLEFSHVSDKEPILEDVDLNDKVQKVLQDLELLVEEKGAQITVAHLPTIKGNRRQLQQLISNLLNNGLKYSKTNVAPELEIRYRLIKGAEVLHKKPKINEEQLFHLIEFHDNGIGFEQAYAEKIFEVFSRLHGKAEYGGSGVGLAIAHKVVTNHKGFIWATGRPGEGATFYVALPVD